VGSASRPGHSLRPGKTRYPLYRRLGGLQGRSGQVRKISPPTKIRSPYRPARSSVTIPTDLPGPLKIYKHRVIVCVCVCVCNILNSFRVTYSFVSRVYYCSKIVGVSVRHIMTLIFKVSISQLHFAESCCKYVASPSPSPLIPTVCASAHFMYWQDVCVFD